MKASFLAPAVFLAAWLGAPGVLAAQVDEARVAFISGDYDDAISGYRRAVREDVSSVAAARGLVDALVEVGRYSDAEEVARRFGSANRGSDELKNRLGMVLYLVGELEDAGRAFEAALEGNASDSALALLNFARMTDASGERERAREMFNWFVRFYNGNRNLTSEELRAVGDAVAVLGRTSPRVFESVIRVYGEAVAADTGNHGARLAMANLLLDKLNGPEANQTLQEILAINPNHPGALLGMARWARFDGSEDPMALVDRALEVNPDFVDALAFKGLLLVESEQYEEAAALADSALAVNPTAIPALAVIAAARFMQGREREFRDVRERVLRRSPHDPEIFNLLAEVSARNRLYAEAAEFAREAVAIDSTSWQGYGLLGMNQLRIGLIEEGRANLERSFAGDPFNVWNKNTLDLVDTFDNYTVTSTAHFNVAIETPESDLLSLYFAPLAEEAYGVLSERYGYTPDAPVRVEVMPTHADFSVRTVGLPGIGALGVSFGPVVAMDSPGARQRGAFNWGSTLWHELVHTFTLGLTGNRAPRWFAEGLAVHEERRARIGWGADADLSFLVAYRRGLTPDFSELNETFVRPRYPEQVVHSYYQASVVLEIVEDQFGWPALLRVMDGYRRGLSTDSVFHSELDLTSADVDDLFHSYMRERYGAVLDELPDSDSSEGGARGGGVHVGGEFLNRIATAVALVEEGRFDEAIPILEEAKATYPEYAGPDSPYLLLARIYRERGELNRAAAELQAFTELDERQYDANVALANVLEQVGFTAAAAAALDRAIYIYPYEIDTHERLATLYEATGELDRAARERRAVVALGPVDMVSAHYELARTLALGGNLREARSAVLRALEQAPNFVAAQDLLLEIREEMRNR